MFSAFSRYQTYYQNGCTFATWQPFHHPHLARCHPIPDPCCPCPSFHSQGLRFKQYSQAFCFDSCRLSIPIDQVNFFFSHFIIFQPKSFLGTNPYCYEDYDDDGITKLTQHPPHKVQCSSCAFQSMSCRKRSTN